LVPGDAECVVVNCRDIYHEGAGGWGDVTIGKCGGCHSFLKGFGLGLFGAFGVDHVREGTKKN